MLKSLIQLSFAEIHFLKPGSVINIILSLQEIRKTYINATKQGHKKIKLNITMVLPRSQIHFRSQLK